MIGQDFCICCMNSSFDDMRNNAGNPRINTMQYLIYLQPRIILGCKYMVVVILGEGSFGIIYIGWNVNLEIKVAVKEYSPSRAVNRNNHIATNK